MYKIIVWNLYLCFHKFIFYNYFFIYLLHRMVSILRNEIWCYISISIYCYVAVYVKFAKRMTSSLYRFEYVDVFCCDSDEPCLFSCVAVFWMKQQNKSNSPFSTISRISKQNETIVSLRYSEENKEEVNGVDNIFKMLSEQRKKR